MSIEALNWALGHMAGTKNMPTATRFVMMLLANFTSDITGTCFPSMRYIMDRTGLSDKGVRDACRDLQARGLLQVTPRARENGSSTSNDYRLAVDISAPPAPPNSLREPPRTTCPTPPKSLPGAPELTSPPYTKDETPPPKGGGSANAPKAKKAKPTKTAIPEAFVASERVLKWASAKKLPPSYVRQCTENFILNAEAKGCMYANWDSALITWINREPIFSKQPPPVERVDHSDKQCRWTNQGKEPRCREDGTIHMGSGQYLCANHHRMVQERKKQTEGAPS